MFELPERPPKVNTKSAENSNNEGTGESDEEKKPKQIHSSNKVLKSA